MKYYAERHKTALTDQIYIDPACHDTLLIMTEIGIYLAYFHAACVFKLTHISALKTSLLRLGYKRYLFDAAGNGQLPDLFSGMSTSSRNDAPASQFAPQQPTPQQLASQRTASLEKQADPLASIGLPQASQAPMGQGSSALRGMPATQNMAGIHLVTHKQCVCKANVT